MRRRAPRRPRKPASSREVERGLSERDVLEVDALAPRRSEVIAGVDADAVVVRYTHVRFERQVDGIRPVEVARVGMWSADAAAEPPLATPVETRRSFERVAGA